MWHLSLYAFNIVLSAIELTRAHDFSRIDDLPENDALQGLHCNAVYLPSCLTGEYWFCSLTLYCCVVQWHSTADIYDGVWYQHYRLSYHISYIIINNRLIGDLLKLVPIICDLGIDGLSGTDDWANDYVLWKPCCYSVETDYVLDTIVCLDWFMAYWKKTNDNSIVKVPYIFLATEHAECSFFAHWQCSE